MLMTVETEGKTSDGDDEAPKPDSEAAVVQSLLRRMRDGDPQAREELFAIVFTELHDLAEVQMRSERLNHTLQPTALVSEAFLRMCRSEHVSWADRKHLMCVAASAMRCVLVDYGRRNRAQKRPPASMRIELEPGILSEIERRTVDLVALDEALSELRTQDEQLAELVDLHFFGGRGFEECGELLGITARTARRWWEVARRILWRSMGETEAPD